MSLLGALPLVAAVIPVAVIVARGQWLWALPGLVFFEWGVAGLLSAPSRGANSNFHYLWMLGLILLTVGLLPKPGSGSWWDTRFGSEDPDKWWAVAPILALPVIIWFSGLAPYLLLANLAVIVFVPVVAGLIDSFRTNPRFRALAIMGSGPAVLVVTLAISYISGAWRFGF